MLRARRILRSLVRSACSIAACDRSFVSNRKNEVLCFLWVAKLEERQRGSFVLNRNWRFWRQPAPGRLAGGGGRRALDRRRAVFDIFTDSSCSCGGRNAKRCVCTGSCYRVNGAGLELVWRRQNLRPLLPGSINLNRPLQSQKQQRNATSDATEPAGRRRY